MTNSNYESGKQMGENAYKITVENTEYLITQTGELFDAAGNKLGLASDYLGDKWNTFLQTPMGAEIVKNFDWVYDETTGAIKTASGTAGGAIVGFVSEAFRDTFLDNLLTAATQTGSGVVQWFGGNWAELKKYHQVTGDTRKKLAAEYLERDENGHIRVKKRSDQQTQTAIPQPPVQTARGDAIAVLENGKATKYLSEDEVSAIRAFATQTFDREDGYFLKVLDDNDQPSSLYYEPAEVVGSAWRRKGSNKPVNLARAHLILSERQYQNVIQEIYLRQKKQGFKDSDFEKAISTYPFMQAQIRQENLQKSQDFVPHTPHTGALKINFLIPGTNNYSMIGLTAEQVAAVRSFVAGKRDTQNQGFKLHVTGNDASEPFSALYYVQNAQGTGYIRRGENNQPAIPYSESTFKLNETQLHATIMGIMQADSERGYQDPNLKKWYDLYVVKEQPTNTTTKVRNGKPVLEGGDPSKDETQQATTKKGTTPAPTGTTEKKVQEDNRNFFLSIGNFIDNSMFGPLAGIVPIPFLSKAITLLGNCLSGLFKTIGYVMEGEWGKAGSQLFGWVRDAAIVGGVVYGAYFLKNKLSGIFDTKSENSSSSSSSNLTDIITGALTNTTTPAPTTPAPTKEPDVYVGLNHSSNGKVAGTVKTFTDSSGTTKRLVTTSDKFLEAGEIRDSNSDGTLWVVKVDKTKSK